MPGRGPVRTDELVVAMDYGQFMLQGADWSATGDPLQLLGQAQDGDGVAADTHTVFVLSPHQNNFEMSLTIEMWSAAPPDDILEWQQVDDATITIVDGTLRYESPTMSGATIVTPSGLYAVRISGRDFVGHGWPGSTRPRDRWRVQLWPTDQPMPPRRCKHFRPTSPLEPANGPGDATATQSTAARITRICDDLCQRVTLSAETTTVRIHREIPTTLAAAYAFLARIYGWYTSFYQPPAGEAINETFTLGGFGDCSIECRYLALTPDTRITIAWNWTAPRSDGPTYQMHSTVSLAVHAVASDRVKVLVEHEAVPQEWEEAVQTLWTAQLHRAERHFVTGFTGQAPL